MKLNKRIEGIRQRILTVLYTFPEWNIQQVTYVGSGVVNAVFLVKEKNLGMLAVRTPWNIEGDLDKAYSLKKEAEIARHCFKYNIPVPKVHKLILSEEISFLVSDFVSGDDSSVSSFDIGQLVSNIHNVPIDDLKIIDQNNRSLSNIISHRVTERNNEFSKLTNKKVMLPNTEELEGILNKADSIHSLLHLDVRPPNIIAANGKIKSIIDWDNAFIGHPIMDLMRISETWELHGGDFLKGYGNDSIIENTEEVIQLIYRLDTALMLVILFRSMIKDTEKANYYMKRVEFLGTKLSKSL
ncbi:phosphotransferase family protein [Bacillus sp. FJAT-45066]|uniref:phosphotransferase family protein n=1 Tax=Bacillus sp. FJAT-45066 TaxID=2011010 RepID=UPI000BB8D181|nr:phosphotransferase [Bacillus sp. FJAT-45066]